MVASYDCHGIDLIGGDPAPVSVVLGTKRDLFVDCDVIRIAKTALGIELVAIRSGSEVGRVELLKGKDYLVEPPWIKLPRVRAASGGWYQSIEYKLTLNQNLDLVAHSQYFAMGAVLLIPFAEYREEWLMFSNKTEPFRGTSFSLFSSHSNSPRRLY